MKKGELLWLPGIILCASGALLIFLSPPGAPFVGASGVAMCCAGGSLFAVAHYLGQDRYRRRNLLLVIMGLACGTAAVVGLAHSVFYAGSLELPHSGLMLSLSLAGIAAGVAGSVYAYRYHVNASLLGLAPELGLSPADSGLTRPDGRYDLKGRCNGAELLLDGTDIEASKGRPHCVQLDIKCRVRNQGRAWLAAYPGGFTRRPIGALPAKIGHVPYWDWYSVHSEPPDAAERILAPLRAQPDNAFQDKYGFTYLEMKDDEARFRFSREGYFSAGYVRHLMSWVARFAELAG